MDEKQNGKAQIVTSKSFLAVGPTLHYSHSNVRAFWAATLLVYVCTCLFWSKILTGAFLPFDWAAVASPGHWRLGRFLVEGVSIFEYPWQILVLALLMGIIAMSPILVSQLLNFSHSFLFIAAVFFIADLPLFALCLLVSCIAVACRPLRFRSRFIAVALCTLPQLIYWGWLGGESTAEPIKWGFTLTPWVSAWLVSLGIAGIVLGIGHFTRYRPGLIFTSTLIVLAAATVAFDTRIGFDELDYQLYVARNNPEQVAEFQEHVITESLDRTMNNPAVIRYLGDFFYPADPNLLRAELKREIQDKLGQDRWPGWFMISPELNYQEKRQWLLSQYDMFINQRSKSRRMPIALYYKAMLNELAPDLKVLTQQELLRFHSDYPGERSRQTWYSLYSDFGQSPESLEARWRIAMLWAGQGGFEQADRLAVEAVARIDEQLQRASKAATAADTIFSPFQPPAETVMTASTLTELHRRVSQLRVLIGKENRGATAEAGKRLARFVMLDPHGRDYADQLAMLAEGLNKDDPLRDNILLAQAKLVIDELQRAQNFSELHKKYKNTDGGMLALYELALLKIHLWRQHEAGAVEQKKQLLLEARKTLTDFLDLYPGCFCAEQVKKNLADLPTAE